MAAGPEPPQPPPASKPRDQEWLDRLRNQPLVAAIIVAAVVVTAIGTFWKSLPASLTDTLTHLVHTTKPADGPPPMGWVFAGYVDQQDRTRWASPPRVAVAQQSGGLDRPSLIRQGDVVLAQRQLPQVIVDYRSRRLANQMTPPWKLRSVIKSADDYTGRKYETNVQLEVLEVAESQHIGGDVALWLRVRPNDPEGGEP